MIQISRNFLTERTEPFIKIRCVLLQAQFVNLDKISSTDHNLKACLTRDVQSPPIPHPPNTATYVQILNRGSPFHSIITYSENSYYISIYICMYYGWWQNFKQNCQIGLFVVELVPAFVTSGNPTTFKILWMCQKFLGQWNIDFDFNIDSFAKS